MEGSSHTVTRPLPTDPKPNPPRPQKKKSTRAKRAKNTHASSSEPANEPATEAANETEAKASADLLAFPRPEQWMFPIDYDVIAMLSSSERYPRDLKSIKVTLSVPAPDEECPIALELISTAELTFLPGCFFFKDTPQYTKMTLPCGHSFSAMTIIYSWCRREMLCPCCRRGLKYRANVNHLPSHFKSQLAAHISSSLTSERVEDERDIITTLLQMTPITTSFEELADSACLEVLVGFYYNTASETPQETMARPLNQRRTTSVGYFSMMVPLTSTQTYRQGRLPVFTPSEQNINVIRQSPADIRSIEITTQMRIRGTGLIDVDSTGEIDLPEPIYSAGGLSRTVMIHRRVSGYTGRSQHHTVLPVVPISTFELTFGQRGTHVFLEHITWIPDSTHVHVQLHSIPNEM
jgi:hypothetical protein